MIPTKIHGSNYKYYLLATCSYSLDVLTFYVAKMIAQEKEEAFPEHRSMDNVETMLLVVTPRKRRASI